MRRAPLFVAAALVVLLALPSSARAVVEIGVDGAVVLPMADWKKSTGTGFGALLKAELELVMVQITGRAGIIMHTDKDNMKTREIPILVGLKWGIGPAYLAGELGFVHNDLDIDAAGVSDPDGEAKLGATLGAGAELGPLDVRLQTFHPSIGDFGDMWGLMATVGYSFISL